MSKLLWAHTLRVAIAGELYVDDADTDKISYSDGWVQCPGPNVVCEGDAALILAEEDTWNHTLHLYV